MPTGNASKGRARLRAVAHDEVGAADKYQVIFDQASDAIMAVEADGRVDAANRAAEDMTGYLRSEIEGASVRCLMPDPSKNHIPDRSRPLSMEALSTPGTYEDICILRKDGYVSHVELSVRLVASEGKSVSIVLLRDVTEKKRMERELITKHAELRNAYFQLEKKNAEMQAMQESLVQAGKMAALGELATGIAHELNQPLQGIRGYAQELQQATAGMTSPQGEGVIEAGLREVISNVDKMASIIGYLRAFVRKSTESHEMTDVHHAIEEALKMLSRQFASRGIEVERHFDAKLPPVYANPLQLEQIFINMAANARDAIESTGRGRGRVLIRTRLVKGDFVEIEFRDDGVGMSDRTKQKAFNPFFTTKEVGKGMGLGLSLSYGFVSKLQGSIMVESELGKGTAFFIRLPRDFREMA